MSVLTGRKLEHLDICANGSVESGSSTLLDEVHLLHEALPELAWGQVDPSVEILGRRLLAPVVITGMTGGAERAGEINRALAGVAQKFGLGMGLGSQRAMLAVNHVEIKALQTYEFRDAGVRAGRDYPNHRFLVEPFTLDSINFHFSALPPMYRFIIAEIRNTSG